MSGVDVARESGVSRATVSYVLNEVPHQTIPPETRRRVVDAARRLGYTPSGPGRALRLGRSDIVLYLLPDWPIGYGPGQVIASLASALADHGLSLLTHILGPGVQPLSAVWRAVSPAAVVGLESLPEHEIEEMRRAGIEVGVGLLSAGRRGPGPLATSQERVGRLQTHHLFERGHRTLGYALPDDPRLHSFAGPRLEGVRRACEELDMAPPVVQTVGLSPEDAARAIDIWQRAKVPPTAVCAYSDDVAVAVLAGMAARRVVAPADLAVIGVDDIPLARMTTPPLSSVDVDLAGVGRMLAASVLPALVGAKHVQPVQSVTERLVIREST